MKQYTLKELIDALYNMEYPYDRKKGEIDALEYLKLTKEDLENDYNLKTNFEKAKRIIFEKYIKEKDII